MDFRKPDPNPNWLEEGLEDIDNEFSQDASEVGEDLHTMLMLDYYREFEPSPLDDISMDSLDRIEDRNPFTYDYHLPWGYDPICGY